MFGCNYTNHPYTPDKRIRIYDSKSHFIGYKIDDGYRVRYYNAKDKLIGYSK
jgi:hypothetical protein